MKTLKNLLKFTAAVAAVAGICYVVIKYLDDITQWLKNLCPCKDVPVVEEVELDTAAPAEAPTEEAAEEVVEAEEPVEEIVPIPEGEPVADDSDFES